MRHCKQDECSLARAWVRLGEPAKEYLKEVRAGQGKDKTKHGTWEGFTKMAWTLLVAEGQEQARAASLVLPTAGTGRQVRGRDLVANGMDASGLLHIQRGRYVWRKTWNSANKLLPDIHAAIRNECALLRLAAATHFVPQLLSVDLQNLTIVLEYVSNITLHRMMKCPNPLLGTKCLQSKAVAYSILCGVQALLDIDVVHRDIHAQNVMLRAHTWSVVFIDLADGIADLSVAGDHVPRYEDVRHAFELAQQVSCAYKSFTASAEQLGIVVQDHGLSYKEVSLLFRCSAPLVAIGNQVV